MISISRSISQPIVVLMVLLGLGGGTRVLHSQDFLDAARLGGPGEVTIDAATRDDGNGVWLAGRFPQEIDADPGPGLHPLVSPSGSAFVIHLGGDGALLWAGQFDGEEWGIRVADLAVAPDGSVAIVGSFTSPTDFDPGPGVRTLVPSSTNADGFLVRLGPTGQLLWTGQVGGVGSDFVTSVAIDGAGGWTVGGTFQANADLDPGAAVATRQSLGQSDIFLLALDATSSLFRLDVLASESIDSLRDVAVSDDGSITVVGSFGGTMDLDPGPQVFSVTSSGFSDGFVARLNAQGSFEWGGGLGGPGSDSVVAAVTDSLGRTYVAGVFQEVADLDLSAAGEALHSSLGASDTFALALAPTGSTEWIRTARGAGYEVVRALALDPTGGLYLAGSIASGSQAIFEVRGTQFQLGSGNGSTAFLWHVDSSGGFEWAGGFRPVPLPNQSGSAYPWDLVVLDEGTILLAGSFESTVDFDPGVTSSELTAGDASDAFIAWVRDVVHPPTTVVVPDERATIQAAIDAAHHFDRILVRSGTYRELIDFRGQHVVLEAFGDEGTVVLEGNGSGPVVAFRNSEGRAARLEGFVVRNGSGLLEGGGVHIVGSPAVVRNVITGNYSCLGGGGIQVQSGAPRIERNQIFDNHQQPDCSGGIGGGGMSLRFASGAEILGNRITGNSWGRYGRGGGGVAFWISGAPLLRDNRIVSNYSDGIGGGITMTNSSFPILVQNVIADNEARLEGGGAYWMTPTGSPAPLLIHNTFANNRATLGSAVYHRSLTNDPVVFVGNILSSDTPTEGLVYCDARPAVFQSNDLYNAGSTLVRGNCADPTGSGGNISEDPRFVAPATLDLRLLADSPAIDAGPGSAPYLTFVDAASEPRYSDGDGDGSYQLDMGAHEHQGTSSLLFRDGFESADRTAWEPSP